MFFSNNNEYFSPSSIEYYGIYGKINDDIYVYMNGVYYKIKKENDDEIKFIHVSGSSKVSLGDSDFSMTCKSDDDILNDIYESGSAILNRMYERNNQE